MKHKVIKVGRHSLAVIIPAMFIHAVGVKAGDDVYLKTNIKNSKITLTFPGAMQLPLLSSSKNKIK